jgi:hypothetical protein
MSMEKNGTANQQAAQYLAYWQQLCRYRAESMKDGRIGNKNIHQLLSYGDIDFDFDPLDMSKIILSSLAAYIPVVGNLISMVIQLFWPQQKANIFAELKEEIEQLINEKMDEDIWEILQTIIEEVNVKLTELDRLIKDENWQAVHEDYKVITAYLVGLEERFKLDKTGSHPAYFTPLYIVMVNIIINFRLEAINHSEKFLITASELAAEKQYLFDLVNGANGAYSYLKSRQAAYLQYIITILQPMKPNWPNNEYNNLVAEYIYYVRSGLHMATADLWKARADKPTDTSFIPMYYELPTPTCGDFSYDYDSCKDLFADAVNAKYPVYLTKVTLNRMKDEGPDVYKKMCGYSASYSDGSSEAKGYNGEDPDVIVGHETLQNLTADNQINFVNMRQNGTFIDVVTLKDIKGDEISVGFSHDVTGTTFTSKNGRYIINRLHCTNINYDHQSGYQTMGMFYTFVWNNNKASETTLEELLQEWKSSLSGQAGQG